MVLEKLKLKEKIGYGFGDAASSMFWKLFGMYIMFFYTDIFGISAVVVGTMFLVTRIGDAVFDPLVGVIADRTNSRWGKFRPFLLWFAFPFGIIGVLTFTTPSLGMTGKIIYAYMTYSLMMIVYSLINVPYASLLGVMTSEGKERTTLATYRFIFAFAGSFLVLFLFQPLFDGFGTRQLMHFNETQQLENSIFVNQKSDKVIFWKPTAKFNNNDQYTDSIVFLTVEISTKSKDAFCIGVLNTNTNDINWIRFKSNQDTLGLIRDGSNCPLKVNLCKLIGKKAIADLSALKVLCTIPDKGIVKLNNVYFKEINYPKGTEYAVIVIAILAIFFFLMTFSWTRERIQPVKIKTSLKKDIFDLITNRPWFILLFASVFTIFFNTIRDGAAIYYFKYYFHSQSTLPMGSVIFSISTIYLLIGQLANIIGVILAKPVSDHIGKKNTFLFAMITATILSMFFYLPTGNCLWIILVMQFFISISAGMIFPLIWSMFADTADYSEWKNKRRATGLVFSAASMSQKFGASIGIGLAGYLLAIYGYHANVEQSELTRTGIRMMLSFYPALGAFMSAVFMFLYPLKESYLKKIEYDLNFQRDNISNDAEDDQGNV